MDKYLQTIKYLLFSLLFTVGLGNLSYAQNEVELTIDTYNAACGDTLVIPVTVADFNDMVALDLSLTWNANTLEFTGDRTHLNSTVGVTLFNFGPYPTPDNDTLTFQWFDAGGVSIPDGDTLFALTFIVRGGGGLMGNILFGDNYTPIAAGKFVNGNIVEVDVITTDGLVNIFDNEPPLIECPEDLTIIAAPNVPGIIVNGLDPSASDNCAVASIDYLLEGATTGSGSGSVSGFFFNKGVTTITYLASDFAGLEADCTFELTVKDTVLNLFVIADSIPCDATDFIIDITAQNFDTIASLQFGLTWDPNVLQFDGLLNFNVDLGLDPFSNFGPSGGIIDTLTFSWFRPYPGETLPDNTVLFSIRFSPLSLAGTNSLVSFISTPSVPIEASRAQAPPSVPVAIGVVVNDAVVHVVDNIAPEIECPADITITIPQTQQSTVVQNIDPNVSDNCDIEFVEYLLTQATQGSGLNTASGQSFNLGTTKVEYLVGDYGGNSDFCSFEVTIISDSLFVIVDIPSVGCLDSTVQVCITTTGFNNLASLQFAVTWDPAILQFTDTTLLNPAISNASFGPTDMGNLNINDTLTFSWFNPFGVSIQDDSTLFCFEFDILNGLNTSSYFNIVDFSSLPIEASVAQQAPQTPITIPVYLSNDTINFFASFPPIITNCPNNVNIGDNTGLCGATFTWPDLVIIDDCDPNVSLDCNFNSGDFFPVGSTQVLCIATNNAGLSDTCSFTVGVIDLTPPVLDCSNLLDIITESVDTLCGNEVSWDLPTATDNCPGDITIEGPDPGGFYPVGSHVITYTATDVNGATSQCSFEIFVLDLINPVIECPADITIAANTDSCTAIIVPPVPEATDNCGILLISYLLDLEDKFPGDTIELPLGTTNLMWFAFDSIANGVSCSYNITVEGGGSYTLLCPENISLSASENCDAIAIWDEPTFTGEGCDTSEVVTVVCDFESGSLFPLGTTIVTCELQGEGGDVYADCSFEVTVNDVSGPVFENCPQDINLVADFDSCGISFYWDDPLVTDNCTDSVALTYEGPAQGFLPNGNYNVVYTATDSSGNVSFCTFTIAVCDTVAPFVQNCPGDIFVNLPEEVDSCFATITWEDPTFTDNCDVDLIITQSHFPGQFGAGLTNVTYTATDLCGNSVICSFVVGVSEIFPPVADCPEDLTIDGDGTIITDPSGFIDSVFLNDCKELQVYFTLPSGTDNCSGSVTTIQLSGPLSGEVFDNNAPNTLVFLISDSSGNSDTCSVDVTVLPYPLNVSASSTVICPLDDVQLFAENIQDATYSWTGPNGFVSTEQNPIIQLFDQVNVGTYTVTVEIENCPTPLTGSITINLLDGPVLNDDLFLIGIGQTITNGNIINNDVLNFNFNIGVEFLSQPSSGTLTNNNDGTFNYVSAPGFVGVVEFIYEICYQECPELCSTGVVTIRIETDTSDECKPNNLITPNDDGRNDVVIIPCIDGSPSKFPFNALKIYNQWGDQVFAASPYQNNWKGTYQGDAGAPLPDGTYYYVFTKGDDTNPITGFITILR
jgi:gliding motility-associated-like protein